MSWDLSDWIETYEEFVEAADLGADVDDICDQFHTWDQMDYFDRLEAFRDRLNGTLADHGYGPVNFRPDPFDGMERSGAYWDFGIRTIVVNEPWLRDEPDPANVYRVIHHEALHIMNSDDAGRDLDEMGADHKVHEDVAAQVVNDLMEECFAREHPPESGAGDDFPEGSHPGDWVVPPADTSHA